MNNIIKLTVLAASLAIGGCNAIRPIVDAEAASQPRVSQNMLKELNKVPAPAGPPITVAVYSFRDMTGQRKPSNTLSLFSSAVTQGAESYLIKTLSEVGNRQWFTVVERVGLDNLLKERQMIKQTREIYDGEKAKMLPPMTLAGVIIEGGIIDYNSNTLTGGTGARWLGVGPYTQYTQDLVVISLRLVSVQTGEVLSSITIEKNLLSSAEGLTAFKFFNTATRAFELDTSQTFNEPGNYALRSAIEAGVIELVKQGERQGLWKYKEQSKNDMVPSQTQTGSDSSETKPQKGTNSSDRSTNGDPNDQRIYRTR